MRHPCCVFLGASTRYPCEGYLRRAVLIKEIDVVSNHNPSCIGGVRKVLTVFGSFEAGVRRCGHVYVSMAQSICQSLWDVFVQMESDSHRSRSLLHRLLAQLCIQ